MDLWIEILTRVGPLAVFGVGFIGFVYWVTQIAPERAERRAARRKAGKTG